jgi:phospholipid/cholesterol/gamma-HCH transport system permease protein
VVGRWRGQPVKMSSVFEQLMVIGVGAIPIVAVLSMTIGLMLAIQLISTLKEFGAQSQAVLAVAVSVTREFGPLITGILVAGRSASALAARLGSMVVSQEIDALRVIGVEPTRYIAVPALIALVIMMPCLTLMADAVAIVGAGLYAKNYLDLSLGSYISQSLAVLEPFDIGQGLIKAAVFGLIIALVGVSTGFSVKGGAEGVGQATTQSVVISISLIVIADMFFTFFLTR